LSSQQSQPYSSRAAREREFHDHDAESKLFVWARQQLNRAKGEFSRPAEIQRFIASEGTIALDYGCGKNATATLLLLDGAPKHVAAFDISEVRVSVARTKVNKRGSDIPVEYLVADGHRTPFDDEAFDLVVGLFILHHLDLPVALKEVKRILKPGGTAIFREPLLHNPVMRVARAITPFARTVDERPLTAKDWGVCASVFPNFEHYERELVSTFFMPLSLLLPQRLQRALARRLLPIDDWLLGRFPSTRKYARLSILVFR
jgi:ubiquinone/menaquinone biosynthesis C-methylase UbiE